MTNLSKVGKYEVQALLGEGAMGVVYRALDPMLNRNVAVKVMNEALALDEDFRTRFLREARAAGSLQHPNIITVYDCGETDGHLYIAMEYVAGTDLEHLMKREVPLTLENKIDLIIGVLNGLSCAHKRGIVHRDVKPANIRVSEEGRALIMDFGIAHTSSSNMTKTGLMIGTPNYMAPEQVVGDAITPQTDIFAVGVVLYELLTNTKPFDGENLHSVLYKIVSVPPASPEKIVTGLRSDLAEIVMKALSKDPGDRYASALDMANALSNASAAISRGGTHSVSRTLSLRSSIEVALRRERDEKETLDRQRTWQRVGAVAAAVVVLLLGATLFLRRGGVTPREMPTPALESAANAAKPVPPSAVPPVGTSVAPPQGTPPSAAPAPSPSTRPSANPRTAAKTDAAAPLSDMTIATSLRTSAQQSRRRAVEAGASGAQLTLGDQHNTAAEQLLKKGQRDDAAREFTQASSAWGDAESAARLAAATAAAAPREQAKPPPVVANAPPVQPIPLPPASNPSAEIAAVVTQYAKAIESRDVGELKRLYPGMSSAQESAFEDFFRSVRSLRAAFSVSNLQVDGTSAEARLSGTYDFVTPNGRNEHQPLTLQAVLRKEGSGWRFVSIR